MPSTETKLHIMLPGLFERMPALAASGLEPRAPNLQRLLAMADRQPMPGQGYSACVFSLFGHPLSEQADLPEAAVNYLIEGEGRAERCFMRADPVHLRADQDRLLLFDSTHLALSRAEAEALATEFNRHFAEEPFHLETPTPSRWYLSSPRCPALRTHGLFEVAGRHIEGYMPRGAEAARWRHLLNEMQMLLFQSPVNQQREAAGRLSVNGIWLSGIGTLPRLRPGAFTRVYAEDPTAAGLARLCQVPQEPIPGHQDKVWARGEARLLVWTELIPSVMQGDAHRWMAVLEDIDRRLGRLLEQMPDFKPVQLLLYPCQGHRYVLTPGKLRRFWRRRKRLMDYAP